MMRPRRQRPGLAEQKARARRRAKEAGIALIMVLGAIAVLTVMLAEFQDDTSAELASAMADRDSVQAEYMARSAVNLARLLIASEPTIRNAIAPLFMLMKKAPPQLPVWEFSDRLLGAFNDAEGAKDFAGTVGVDLSLGKNLGLTGGHWELVIVDEDSKIDANLGASNDIAHIRLGKQLMGLMSPPLYDPMFSKKDSQGNFNDRLSICSALIDWADPDDNLFSCDMTTQGASGNAKEDAYYQLLQKAYFRKNAPYDSLEELHMVRGVTDDFWTTFVDPEPMNPKKRLMTVWGQGAVNVNTANPLTLLGILCSATKPGTAPARVRERTTALPIATTPRRLDDLDLDPRRRREPEPPRHLQRSEPDVALHHGDDDGQRHHDGGAALWLGAGLHRHDEGAGDARTDAHDARDPAGVVPVGERFCEVDHDGEQDVFDVRGRRRKGIQARDAPLDPRGRRLPDGSGRLGRAQRHGVESVRRRRRASADGGRELQLVGGSERDRRGDAAEHGRPGRLLSRRMSRTSTDRYGRADER